MDNFFRGATTDKKEGEAVEMESDLQVSTLTVPVCVHAPPEQKVSPTEVAFHRQMPIPFVDVSHRSNENERESNRLSVSKQGMRQSNVAIEDGVDDIEVVSEKVANVTDAGDGVVAPRMMSTPIPQIISDDDLITTTAAAITSNSARSTTTTTTSQSDYTFRRYGSASNFYELSFGGLSSQSENDRSSFHDSQESRKIMFLEQVKLKNEALQNERKKRAEEKIKSKKREIIQKIMDERRIMRKSVKEGNIKVRSITGEKVENKEKERSKSASERPKERERERPRPRPKSTSDLINNRKRKADDGDWAPWAQPVVKPKVAKRDDRNKIKASRLGVIREENETTEKGENTEEKGLPMKKSPFEKMKKKVILSTPVAATSAVISNASRFLTRAREKAMDKSNNEKSTKSKSKKSSPPVSEAAPVPDTRSSLRITRSMSGTLKKKEYRL